MFFYRFPVCVSDLLKPSTSLRDAFDLLDVIQIVAGHGFDQHPESQLTTLGVRHGLGHDCGRRHG